MSVPGSQTQHAAALAVLAKARDLRRAQATGNADAIAEAERQLEAARLEANEAWQDGARVAVTGPRFTIDES